MGLPYMTFAHVDVIFASLCVLTHVSQNWPITGKRLIIEQSGQNFKPRGCMMWQVTIAVQRDNHLGSFSVKIGKEVERSPRAKWMKIRAGVCGICWVLPTLNMSRSLAWISVPFYSWPVCRKRVSYGVVVSKFALISKAACSETDIFSNPAKRMQPPKYEVTRGAKQVEYRCSKFLILILNFIFKLESVFSEWHLGQAECQFSWTSCL